jgi:hypothetical protein
MVKLGIQRRPLDGSRFDSVTIRFQGQDGDGHRIVNAIHIAYEDLESLAAGEPVAPLRTGPSSPAPLGIVDTRLDTTVTKLLKATWRSDWKSAVAETSCRLPEGLSDNLTFCSTWVRPFSLAAFQCAKN